MLTKNFLRTGPNGIDYYQNDPLHPEFLSAFEKTSYYTTTWKKRLKVPHHHWDQYTLDWRGPLHISTGMGAMEALLQKHVDEYTEWKVVAFYVLNDLKVKKQNDWWYSDYLPTPNIRFGAFRDELLYELILQEELLIYSYEVNRYLSRVRYYARGHAGEGCGIGTIVFKDGGYRILDKVQWSFMET